MGSPRGSPRCPHPKNLLQALGSGVVASFQQRLQPLLLLQQPQPLGVGAQHRLHRRRVVGHHLFLGEKTKILGFCGGLLRVLGFFWGLTLLAEQHVDVGGDAERAVGDVLQQRGLALAGGEKWG